MSERRASYTLSEPIFTGELPLGASSVVVCRGCLGRGWVDSRYRGPTLCPVCLGTGAPETEPAKITYTPPFETGDPIPPPENIS